MDIFIKAMDIFENIVFVAGILILIIGLAQLFLSLGSQNADSKNHSGLIIASGIGIMLVSKILIPMISSQVSF